MAKHFVPTTEKKTRAIPEPVRCMLWGRSAGRCEWCNRPVSYHPCTKETVNLAEAAHIIGFSEAGPRGEQDLSDELAQDIDNLMLLCRLCHKTIDTNKAQYPVDWLRRMKREHEQRIERVAAIGQERESHILLYGANVGDHSSPVSYRTAAPALIADERYPARDVLELGMVNSSFRDRTNQFWQVEAEHLRTMVQQQVRPRLTNGHIQHLSVFALAPQPLLIRLGTLLTDINDVQVFPRSREPQGWNWRRHPAGFRFIVQRPKRPSGPPAMVLSLSGTLNDDRVATALKVRPTLWKVTIKNPHNDFLRSKEQLRQFRQLARRLMDEIKAMHGQKTTLHIFPAAPAAIAVELGRVRMPKADMPWQVWDQVNDRGGFIPSLHIN